MDEDGPMSGGNGCDVVCDVCECEMGHCGPMTEGVVEEVAGVRVVGGVVEMGHEGPMTGGEGEDGSTVDP